MFLSVVFFIGITFSMPYHIAGGDNEISLNISPEMKKDEADSDEDADKWLLEMGISNKLNVVNTKQ